MADEGVVAKKVGEFLSWVRSTTGYTQVRTDDGGLRTGDIVGQPEPADPDVDALHRELERLETRIVRLETDIAQDEHDLKLLAQQYGADPSKFTPMVRVKVNARVRSRNSYMAAMRETVSMRNQVQEQLLAFENTQHKKSYVGAMRGAHTKLKTQITDRDINEVEDLEDDRQELYARATELTNAVTRRDKRYDVDDDDLAEELSMLLASPTSAPVAEAPLVVLPDAPHNTPVESSHTSIPARRTERTALEDLL